jgi:DNA-binding HxlR family transcriptional regulator
VEHELIEQFPSAEHPGREAYRLTKKGKSLLPVLKSILDWGLVNIDGTRAELLEQSKRT